MRRANTKPLREISAPDCLDTTLQILFSAVKGSQDLRDVKSLHGTCNTFSVSPLIFSLHELEKKRNHKKQMKGLSFFH